MAEQSSMAVLQTVLSVGAAHGVEHAGICRLGDLSRLIDCRGRSQLPASGSVILLLLPYYTGDHPQRNVALYSVPDDYHRIAGAILEVVVAALRRQFPTAVLQPFVDSSPIPEVEAAQLAGLGFCGRNGQLITPWYGSMAFICEIVTNLELTPGEPANGSCGQCRRCMDACPTGAIGDSGFDRARCRSELTQKKGELSEWESDQVARGGFVWGCDICTEACPHNHKLPRTTVAAFDQNLQTLLQADKLDVQITQKSYVWRGKAVLRRNLELVEQQRERK